MDWTTKESEFIPSRIKIFFSSPQHPDWLWRLPALLLNKYLELFSWVGSAYGVKLIICLHPVLRLRVCGAIPPCLHDIVLN
jgi:hypothetical protein